MAMHTPLRTVVLALTALVSTQLSACSGDMREVLVPEDVVAVASDAQNIEVGSSVAVWLALFPTSAVNPQLRLADNIVAAKALDVKVRPKNCLTTQVTGNRVTYTYNKCFGALGTVEINGQTEARLESADDGIDMALAGGMTFGNAPVQFAGSSQVRIIAGERVLRWQGTVSGTRKKIPFAIESREEWRFAADGCWTRNGFLTGERSNRSQFSAQHDNVRRCDFRTCPSGRVRVVGNLIRNPNRRFAADLLFDGTPTLRVRDEAGQEHTTALSCDEAP
jgi:hypothetical protein